MKQNCLLNFGSGRLKTNSRGIVDDGRCPGKRRPCVAKGECTFGPCCTHTSTWNDSKHRTHSLNSIIPALSAAFKRQLVGTEFKDMDAEKWKAVVRRALGELLATATLLFIGCMGTVGGLSSKPDHFAVAFNFGIAVMAGLIVSPSSNPQRALRNAARPRPPGTLHARLVPPPVDARVGNPSGLGAGLEGGVGGATVDRRDWSFLSRLVACQVAIISLGTSRKSYNDWHAFIMKFLWRSACRLSVTSPAHT